MTNYLNSIRGKVALAIIITTLIITSGQAIFSTLQVSNSFDYFVISQNAAFMDWRAERQTLPIGDILEFRAKQLEDDFKENIYRSIIISAAIGFVLAIGISLGVSLQVTQPLRHLKDAMKNLKNKNFRKKIKPFGPDEVQELTESYNEMIGELDRIEELRDDMISDISHELKTPLTKLRGQLEGINDGVYKAEEVNFIKLLDNLGQLEYFVDQLQHFTEVKTKRDDLNKEAICLLDVVDSVISGYEGKKIKFNLKIDEKIDINADRYKLREILDNLISNAYKYMNKGTITVEFDGETLSVKDTGPGIPKADLPYIFERLYRVEKSRNKNEGGLGLGLAIVKELVDAHEWTIDVKSRKGKGTAFSIHIPHKRRISDMLPLKSPIKRA